MCPYNTYTDTFPYAKDNFTIRYMSVAFQSSHMFACLFISFVVRFRSKLIQHDSNSLQEMLFVLKSLNAAIRANCGYAVFRNSEKSKRLRHVRPSVPE